MKEENDILIVEDDNASKRFVEVILDKHSYTYDSVSDGEKGLYKFKYGNYKCIFVDIKLPKMNGIELVNNIRKHEKDNNLTPAYLIAITAHIIFDIGDFVLEHGFDDYISKPFTIPRLIESLEKII